MTLRPEDIVKRLIDHMASQDAELQADFAAVPEDAGQMTAHILRFGPQRRLSREADGEPARVLDLRDARKARAQARTVSGIFVYTARL